MQAVVQRMDCYQKDTDLMLTIHSHTLMAPRGYYIAGISGSCGKWVDGFQIIITR